MALVVLTTAGAAAGSGKPLTTPAAISFNGRVGLSAGYDKFLFSFENTASTTDALTVEEVGGKITHFQLNGYAASACKPSGVRNAFLCSPINIAKGVKVTGSGETAAPLTKTSSFKTFWTPDGFRTTYSEDVSLNASTPVASALHAWISELGFKGEKSTDNGKTWEPNTEYINVLPAKLTQLHERVDAHGRAMVDAGGNLWWEEFDLGGGDIGSPQEVDVSIQQRFTGKASCQWLQVGAVPSFKPGPCNKPVWLPATVNGGLWTFESKMPLQIGNYIIEAAASSNGKREIVFNAQMNNRDVLKMVHF